MSISFIFFQYFLCASWYWRAKKRKHVSPSFFKGFPFRYLVGILGNPTLSLQGCPIQTTFGISTQVWECEIFFQKHTLENIISVNTKHISASSAELMVMVSWFLLKAGRRGVREQLNHSFLHLSNVYWYILQFSLRSINKSLRNHYFTVPKV